MRRRVLNLINLSSVKLRLVGILFSIIFCSSISFAADPCRNQLSLFSRLQPVIDQVVDLIAQYQKSSTEESFSVAMHEVLDGKFSELERLFRDLGVSEAQQKEVRDAISQKVLEVGLGQRREDKTKEEIALEEERKSFYNLEEVDDLSAVNTSMTMKYSIGEWSADGKLFAAGSDGSVTLYDTQSWKPLGSVKVPDRFDDLHWYKIHLAKFSDDGQFLFVATVEKVYRFKISEILESPDSVSPESHLLYLYGGPAMINSSDLVRSRDKIYLGTRFGVYVVDVNAPYISLKNEKEWASNASRNFYGGVEDKITVSEDGKFIVSINRENQKPSFIREIGETEGHFPELENPKVDAVAFSHGGKIVAVSGYYKKKSKFISGIFLINTDLGEIITSFTTPEDAGGPPRKMSFSPDGKNLYAVYHGGGGKGVIYRWDLSRTNAPFRTAFSLFPKEEINGLSFSPHDGELAVMGSIKKVRIFRKAAPSSP